MFPERYLTDWILVRTTTRTSQFWLRHACPTNHSDRVIYPETEMEMDFFFPPYMIRILIFSVNIYYVYGDYNGPVGVFTVRPDPPFNCTSGERTLFSVRVWCTQGFDGGITQRFALEAYDSETIDGSLYGPADGFGGPAVAADGPAPPLLANITSDRPDFTLRPPSPSAGLRLAVYAYNSRGTSDRTWLTAYTLNSADKQTTSGTRTIVIYFYSFFF